MNMNETEFLTYLSDTIKNYFRKYLFDKIQNNVKTNLESQKKLESYIIDRKAGESDREYIVSESPCYIYGKSNTVPCIVHREKGLNLFTPNPSQEEILLFSSHLIHGGGINDNADTTRVSLEMRFSPVNI